MPSEESKSHDDEYVNTNVATMPTASDVVPEAPNYYVTQDPKSYNYGVKHNMQEEEEE